MPKRKPKTTKPRIPRPIEHRIDACETHLFHLHEAVKLFPQQYDRYKPIAGVLRVLVCKTNSNSPLLLDLMDELGFNYDVPPPGPPGPITMPHPLVGWRDDPDHQAHVLELEEAAGDQQKRAAILEKYNAKFRKSMPLREYTDKALAAFIRPYDYSFCQLVLSIAQQCGSSHEDKEIDEPIAQMGSLLLLGVESHVAVLIEYARLVIDAGAKFIRFSADKGLYHPRYLAKKST
jgi:hypothetical protein